MRYLSEYFFQRRSLAVAERIPEHARAELLALVASVDEHGSASELLWAHEHPAHALAHERQAVTALQAARKLIAEVGGAEVAMAAIRQVESLQIR